MATSRAGNTEPLTQCYLIGTEWEPEMRVTYVTFSFIVNTLKKKQREIGAINHINTLYVFI